METYGTKIYGGKCGKKYGKTCGETKVAKQIWKRSTQNSWEQDGQRWKRAEKRSMCFPIKCGNIIEFVKPKILPHLGKTPFFLQPNMQY